MIKKIAATALLAGSVAATAQTTAQAVEVPEALGATVAMTTELIAALPHVHDVEPPPAFTVRKGNAG
ncbi:hypothetical protein [Streptomyces albofaciens]|uniref:hypothetical protein n=1 Tax=Streptomyces albofaciens TaxID=66866 RepID=UPI0012394ED4|nr:hypothetical protein [Streptomyces albofaciens]